APSGKRPERLRQPERSEDRLTLVTCARPPVRLQPRVPPGMSEIAEELRRDRRARWASFEPPRYVLLRPEEIHRASREDDVVPPVSGRHEHVEKEVRSVDALPADVDRIRLPAVGADRLDPAVDLERGADPERVPGAVRIPPLLPRVDAIRRR